MFKNFLAFLLVSLMLFSCSKEVKIDIPGYQEQLVVDGKIETGSFPIVLLSKSANIYQPTYLGSYLQTFVQNAFVTVSNGVDTIQLELFAISELPIESQYQMAEMLDLEPEDVVLLPIFVYSTTNELMRGVVNKSYTLTILESGKTYQATTFLPPVTPLESLYWLPENANPNYGKSWGRLADPASQVDAYKWEVKRINISSDNQPKDLIFKRVRNAYFNDKFFNGLTFDFEAENPMRRKDSTHLVDYKRFYRLGDSVVVKFSKMDLNTYNFFDKKFAQMSSASSPFSTPINVPTNLSGGALGIWAGYSPWYDTLYCQP